jgi:TRAP-type C4-dicarboxylate transport system permease small subunit
MLTPRLKRTLIYSLVVFCFTVPTYYLVYTTLWDEVSSADAWSASLMYGVLNMLFLGAVHYYIMNKQKDEE